MTVRFEFRTLDEVAAFLRALTYINDSNIIFIGAEEQKDGTYTITIEDSNNDRP